MLEEHTAILVFDMKSGGRLQFGVFRLGFLENRDIRVGFLPEREEILVGAPGLVLFS